MYMHRDRTGHGQWDATLCLSHLKAGIFHSFSLIQLLGAISSQPLRSRYNLSIQPFIVLSWSIQALPALRAILQDKNVPIRKKNSEQTFKLFQSQERDLVNKYNHVVGLWRRIATVTGELRYVDAMRLLYTLEDASKGLGIHEFSSLLT
ncbi:hypothetical protein CK203_038223 [Vitis vinifera]|uniref:Uncharacterized protein n=1 Tax=Vitis vinifera TaxID=29760 RepID=A0A438IBM1_VITVI|nr:hypothetical protein CK203_038223 [Vitis vinifera]